MKNWERWLLPLGFVLLLLVPDFSLFSALGLGLAGVALWRKPVLPDLEKREWIGFGLLAALLLGHLFWFYPTGFEFSLLPRVAFFALFWFAWRGFTAQLRWVDFWWPLAGGIGFVSALLLAGTFSGNHLLWLGSMAPEGLGAALVLWWALPAPKQLAARVAQPIMAGLALAFLAVTDLMGLAAVLLAMILVLVWNRKKEALLSITGAVVLAAICFFALRVPGPALPNFKERAETWRATGALIKANPLGVGVDRFAFTFPTFSRPAGGDQAIYLSPKNEFLRWAAEDGLPLTVLFFLFFGYFLFQWQKKGRPEKEVFLPVSAFFLIEMLVAAPWQNPIALAVGAVVLGAVGAGIWKRRMLPAHAGARALLMVSWIFLFICLGRVVVSRAFEKTNDVFRAKVACRAVSSNWRACLNYSSLLAAQGETTEARREIERVLEREPWNFVAIRNLGSIALRQGDRLEACFLTWKYDDLFSGQSELSEQYQKNCPPKWRDYFARKRPQKYYRR